MVTVYIKDKKELVSDSIDKFSFLIDEKTGDVQVKHKDEVLGSLTNLLGADVGELKNVEFK